MLAWDSGYEKHGDRNLREAAPFSKVFSPISRPDRSPQHPQLSCRNQVDVSFDADHHHAATAHAYKGLGRRGAVPWRGTASSVRHHEAAVMSRHVAELHSTRGTDVSWVPECRCGVTNPVSTAYRKSISQKPPSPSSAAPSSPEAQGQGLETAMP